MVRHSRENSNGKGRGKLGQNVLFTSFGILVGWNIAMHNLPFDNAVSRSNAAVEETMMALRSPMQKRRRQRKIYIDLGVNCGNTYYRFKDGMEIGSSTTLSTSDWEAYLWEANPQMIEWYLDDLVKKETAKGMKVALIPKAAATQDGVISFFLTKGQGVGTKKDNVPNSLCDPNSRYNPSGASTIYGDANRAGEEVKVPAIDFLAWFKELELQAGDIVHLKADIEGAELDIIEAFLADDTNQICFWSQFWTEYHASIFPKDSAEHKRHSEFEKTFPKEFEKKCGRMPWPNGVLK